MNTRTIIINALSAFELHKEVPAFSRARILKAKALCYAAITGERYTGSMFARVSRGKGLLAAGIAGLILSAGLGVYVVTRHAPFGEDVAGARAFVTFYLGSVSVERKGEQVPLAIKAEIMDGDVVRVQEQSCLVVQTVDGLVVRFESGTEAEISMLSDARSRSVNLRQGRVLSMVNRLSKENNYEVRAGTALAAVRGTMFLTQYNGSEMVVAVSEGKVGVRGIKDEAAERIVEREMSAVHLMEKSETSLRAVNNVEKLELSKLQITPQVDDIVNRTPEEISVMYNDDTLRQKEDSINSQIEDATGMSFERMSEKFGRVDILTLYTGQEVRGVIVSRGEYFSVITANGPVQIKAEDVQNTETVTK